MIGIIAAMQEEVNELLALMQNVNHIEKQGIAFWEGVLSDKEVVLMKSGTGKGNAAMSTTILLSNYAISAILNIGTAGGLVEDQNVLDLVIGKSVVQHDYDTSPVDGDEGYGLRYVANTHLLEVCEELFKTYKEPYHVGEIATGDQFIAHQEQWERILKYFPQAICAEMEAGAIAQVCSHFQVPFVVIRSLSDITSHPKSHLDFGTYVKKASLRSATLCKAVVESL